VTVTSGSTVSFSIIDYGLSQITVSHDFSGQISSDSFTIHVLIIKNGTYFMENSEAEKYAQVDDDDAPNYSNNGGIMEIFDFDGEDYQKWVITYTEDGYYTIKSSVSNYAITVPTGHESDNNVDLILKPDIGSDNQKWKITLTPNDAYKIKAKSSESYTAEDLVMDLSNYVAPVDGINLRQRDFIGNNNSYRDEWWLYKIDGDEVMLLAIKTYDIDTVSGYKNVFKYMFSSNHNDFNFIYTDNLSSSSCLNQMENASVIVCSCHGNYNTDSSWIRLNFSDPPIRVYSDQIYDNNQALVDFSSVELVIYSSCYSGMNSNTGKNLVDASVNAGADCAIGFKDTINASWSDIWLDIFFEYRYNHGYSIDEAADEATSSVCGFSNKVYILHHQ